MSNLHEQLISKMNHQKYTPVLISSKFLRQFQAGQVDVAYWHKGELVLCEVKSSAVGIMAMQKSQNQRLKNSAALLSDLLNCSVRLKFIAKR
jgi:hypothetical protein